MSLNRFLTTSKASCYRLQRSFDHYKVTDLTAYQCTAADLIFLTKYASGLSSNLIYFLVVMGEAQYLYHVFFGARKITTLLLQPNYFLRSDGQRYCYGRHSYTVLLCDHFYFISFYIKRLNRAHKCSLVLLSYGVLLMGFNVWD